MFFILLLKPLLKSKIIFDMRGVLPEEFLIRSTSIKFKFFSKIFKFFERFFLKVSDEIVTVSDAFKLYLLDEYSFISSDSISVIPTYSMNNNFLSKDYVDCKLKYFNDKSVDLYVYSGSLEVWQKFDDVISIFSEISKQNKNARLVVFTKDSVNANHKLLKFIDKNLFSVDSLTYDDLILSLPSCDFGFLIRDNNIVNRVASPIKFSDYINANIFVLASDNIGDVSNYIKKFNIGIIINSINKIKYNVVFNEINSLKLIDSNETDKNFKSIQSFFSLGAASDSYINLYKRLSK